MSAAVKHQASRPSPRQAKRREAASASGDVALMDETDPLVAAFEGSAEPGARLRRALYGAKGEFNATRIDIDDLVVGLRTAPPLVRIEAERAGVPGGLVKAMARSMGIANVRMFEIIGVPRATAEKRAASNTPVTGASGQAALGVARLLGMAKAMAERSDAEAAREFDTARWLGLWIERPQPALGGRTPAQLLDTPTGLASVERLLGAIESGAYQ